MEDMHLNVEPNCSEETKEALKTALRIAAESLSNDFLCSLGGKHHQVILNCPTRTGFIQECRDCGKEIGTSVDRIIYPLGYTEGEIYE
jgi:hypothetical protein